MSVHVVDTIFPKNWPNNHKRRDQNLRNKSQKHILILSHASDKK